MVKGSEGIKTLNKISDFIIRRFLEKEIINSDDLKAMNIVYDNMEGIFRATKYHISILTVKKNKIMKEALDI